MGTKYTLEIHRKMPALGLGLKTEAILLVLKIQESHIRLTSPVSGGPVDEHNHMTSCGTAGDSASSNCCIYTASSLQIHACEL